jgi:DNA repair protein RadA/Sms
VLVVGEVGLTGEVRAVAGLETRLKEAAALGFRAAVVPRSNIADGARLPLPVTGVTSVADALSALLD